MKHRPRIGITMRLELATRRFYLGRDYSEAVEAAGGIPFHLSLIPDRDFISSALGGLDGILLPGSDSDVDPKYYGEEPNPALGNVVPEKDETEFLVLEEAERRNLPVLAICYGMQALNVFRGGSLIQDVASNADGSYKHQQGLPLDRLSHSISIDKQSIFSTFESAAANEFEVRVNSHHHQAVREVGTNLKAVAWAKDGIVECIQDIRDNRSILGVQWHPEIAWRKDPLSSDIFNWFIHECSRNRNSNKDRQLINSNAESDLKLVS
jgi:putative glutamine amidotransferase